MINCTTLSLVLTIVIALVVKHFEGDAVSGIMCGILAGIVTMCLGVAKEVWDKFRGTGFDLQDLLANAILTSIGYERVEKTYTLQEVTVDGVTGTMWVEDV